MDTLGKLRKLIQSRGWSEYRLAQECGLNVSTIANIYRRNTMPTIATLEAICAGFGITLAQFLAEGDLVEVTPALEQLLDAWTPLTPEQKNVVLLVAESYHADKLVNNKP